MRIRFASWNINNRLPKASHFELIDKINCDILALQEVNPKFYTALSLTSLFDSSSFSLSLEKPAKNKAHSFGCALFGTDPFDINSSFVLEQSPFPERTLVSNFVSSHGSFMACSFHTPPGASWKELKPKSHRLLAEWLSSHDRRLILAIDANTPKVDHPDITKNEWWWDDEPLLLGASPLHNLKDTYRTFLKSNPEVFQEIIKMRPDGPLAVSYVRGKHIQCRYDFIYVTPDIRVCNAEYLYQESKKAGSDHAIVLADLEFMRVSKTL